jgi:hypothetical protein
VTPGRLDRAQTDSSVAGLKRIRDREAGFRAG